MFQMTIGSRTLARRQAAWGVTTALALVLSGCGGGEEKVQSSETSLRVPVEQTATVASAGGVMPTTADREGEVVASVDSLAPEIAVEVENNVVEPGAAIEITALGSPDVRDVILTDGLGKASAFVYDLPAKAWKAYYRVPMKPHGERLGLSVTAKNDGNRWRRVWLFLQIQDQTLSTVPAVAQEDSTR